MSLEQDLRALTENVRTQAPADVLATIDAAVDTLATGGLAARTLRAGQRMPDFTLPDATGRQVSSAMLRERGPLLVIFYRGEWCPYCNLALRAFQAGHADFAALGVELVAISPEQPDHALTMQQKHALEFPVLSDAGLAVARNFGLVYTLDERLRPIYENFGVDLPARNGTASFELPVPANYLVDRDGTVLEAHVDVDYRRRLEPATALEWIARHRAAARA